VPATGFGLVVYSGGSVDQLVTAAACNQPGLAFWATVNGEFVIYLPGTQIAAVNADFLTAFPGGVLPSGSALVAKCT
jgi:hypothetical protein